MNKNQEALTNLKTYIVDYDDEFGEDIYLYEYYKEEFDLLQELVDKHEELEQENFELRQQLNTEEECGVMLEKKVKKQLNIIKSLCKALEDNEIDLSYLIFSYLTPEEWLYCKEWLDYERAKF